jgi:hypothetical protein
VTKKNKLLGKPRYHALGATIELGRNALCQWRKLSNAQRFINRNLIGHSALWQALLQYQQGSKSNGPILFHTPAFRMIRLTVSIAGRHHAIGAAPLQFDG